MNRRVFFKWGLAGAALAVVGGGAALWSRKTPVLLPLGQDQRTALMIVASAILGPMLPASPVSRQEALRAWLTDLEAALERFPPATRAELAQAFDLLSSDLGRRWLVGLSDPWTQSSDEQVREALQKLRVSSLSIKRQIYQALHGLVNGVYFADESHWVEMGYPGPTAI